MGTCTIEGTGIAQLGQEEDYLELGIGKESVLFGITELVEAASGIKVSRSSVQRAFEFELDTPPKQTWARLIDQYRSESKRQYPPVFRVRITVEAEALDDAEIEAWWHEKQESV